MSTSAARAQQVNFGPVLDGVERESSEKQVQSGKFQEFFFPPRFVVFSPEERAVIDYPAFQRLAGMHQLGLAHLVYRGAAHRRIEHVLGTVGPVQRILDALRVNCHNGQDTPPTDWQLGGAPSEAEIGFVRLGALLHDIGHVPYGHTFEDELHLLPKHDEDHRLDLILKQDTWYGKKVTPLEKLVNDRYVRFVPAPVHGTYSACDIAKLIIRHVDDKPADDSAAVEEDEASAERRAEERMARKELAVAGIRVRMCRDMIGNTICADLLDYLHRDWYHIGKPKHFDERILQYMEIRTRPTNATLAIDGAPAVTPDDRLVISLGVPPNFRSDGVSAILDLLESRYQLSEAVLFHKTKMTATAMLERVLSLLLPPSGDRTLWEQAWATSGYSDLEEWLINTPEDALLFGVFEKSKEMLDRQKSGRNKLSDDHHDRWTAIRKLSSKLMRRDLHDQLLTITYSELDGSLSDHRDHIQQMFGDDPGAEKRRADALRLLEHDYKLPTGSLGMYCPESRMNSKVAEVQIFVNGSVVDSFVEYERKHKNQLSSGHLAAQVQRFLGLWRVVFTIDPEVFPVHPEIEDVEERRREEERREEFLALLRRSAQAQVLGLQERKVPIERTVARIARNAWAIEDFPWKAQGKTLRSTPLPVGIRRQYATDLPLMYPMKVPRLVDFMDDGERREDS